MKIPGSGVGARASWPASCRRQPKQPTPMHNPESAQSPQTVRALLRIFPRQPSRFTSKFRKNRAWQHSAVTSATESRPKPKAAEVIFRRGDPLPISVTKALREMIERG